MQSYNKTISVIKKNEGDLFVALEFFECILYWVSGILYLLFCSFSLKRCPSNRIIFRVHKTWIHTPGLDTPGRWSYSSVRGSFYPREQEGCGGIWSVSGGHGWIKCESLEKFHRWFSRAPPLWGHYYLVGRCSTRKSPILHSPPRRTHISP